MMSIHSRYTASQLASELNLSPITVGKIFASMKVRRGGREFNVGLKLKSTSGAVANPEWTEQRQGKWYYGEAAKLVLVEYVERFPAIVQAIQSSESIWFEGDFSDTELRCCYEWATAFRNRTYTRVGIEPE
jgi:hypothetical protein